MEQDRTSPTRTALVAGATGLVGRELLGLLLADERYAAVHSVGRRTQPGTHPKLHQHVLDFAALSEALPAVDDVFIALGTTIKVAGSETAFRAVDFDAVVAVATAARACGATRLGVVSAMGASRNSAIFYNRVKGDMEAAVSLLGYTSVVIARPSFLAGDRAALGQPVRPGEGWALSVSRKFGFLIPANYRSVRAIDVARALFTRVREGEPGKQIVLSGSMQG